MNIFNIYIYIYIYNEKNKRKKCKYFAVLYRSFCKGERNVSNR